MLDFTLLYGLLVVILCVVFIVFRTAKRLWATGGFLIACVLLYGVSVYNLGNPRHSMFRFLDTREEVPVISWYVIPGKAMYITVYDNEGKPVMWEYPYNYDKAKELEEVSTQSEDNGFVLFMTEMEYETTTSEGEDTFILPTFHATPINEVFTKELSEFEIDYQSPESVSDF